MLEQLIGFKKSSGKFCGLHSKKMSSENDEIGMKNNNLLPKQKRETIYHLLTNLGPP